MKNKIIIGIFGLTLGGCATTADRETTELAEELRGLLHKCDMPVARAKIEQFPDDRFTYGSNYGVSQVDDYPKDVALQYLTHFEVLLGTLQQKCFAGDPETLEKFYEQMDCWRKAVQSFTPYESDLKGFAVSNFDSTYKDRAPEYPFRTWPSEIFDACAKAKEPEIKRLAEKAQNADEVRWALFRAKEKEEEETFNASAAGISSDACNLYSLVEVYQKAVDEEMELKATIDTYDRPRLYNASKHLKLVKASLDRRRQDYARKANAAWSPTLCLTAAK